jgi:hypothetical protein
MHALFAVSLVIMPRREQYGCARLGVVISVVILEIERLPVIREQGKGINADKKVILLIWRNMRRD